MHFIIFDIVHLPNINIQFERNEWNNNAWKRWSLGVTITQDRLNKVLDVEANTVGDSSGG